MTKPLINLLLLSLIQASALYAEEPSSARKNDGAPSAAPKQASSVSGNASPSEAVSDKPGEDVTKAAIPAQTSTPKKQGRPAHMFDFSSTGISGSGENEFRASLDNRLFTIGDGLTVRNTLRAGRLDAKLAGIPDRLYSLSEMLSAASDEYLFIGMIGSPSDKPFHSRHELLLMGSASRRIWQSGSHSLSAAVFMMNTKYWGCYIPIPFISYNYRDETLTAAVGAPTLIFWKLSRDLTFSFTYFPVIRFETALLWRPVGPVTVGPELSFIEDRYFIADRPDKEQKLYRRYLSAAIVAKTYISSFSGVSLKAGYIPYSAWTYSRESLSTEGSRSTGAEFFFTGGVNAFMF